jgi:mannosyltransferase OCH1-like enzyme
MQRKTGFQMPSFLRSGIVPDPVPAQPPYIPRILWQTTEDRATLPQHLAECVEKLKAMNPTWEHRLFDKTQRLEALRAVCSDRFMRAYGRTQPRYGAMRADLFRYVMVYLHGGAYLDLKSGTSRPLDEILRPDDHFLFSQWDNGPDGKFPGVGFRKSMDAIPGGEYPTWFVIGEPGHPFLAATIELAMQNIENYNPFVNGYGGESVMFVAGPDAYTHGIRSLENDFPHRFICAWREGLCYSMLADRKTHMELDKTH